MYCCQLIRRCYWLLKRCSVLLGGLKTLSSFSILRISILCFYSNPLQLRDSQDLAVSQQGANWYWISCQVGVEMRIRERISVCMRSHWQLLDVISIGRDIASPYNYCDFDWIRFFFKWLIRRKRLCPIQRVLGNVQSSNLYSCIKIACVSV